MICAWSISAVVVVVVVVIVAVVVVVVVVADRRSHHHGGWKERGKGGVVWKPRSFLGVKSVRISGLISSNQITCSQGSVMSRVLLSHESDWKVSKSN